MQQGNQEPRFVTPDELAVILRTTRRAIYGQVYRGTLPQPLRRGRRWLFDLDKVIKFLVESRASSPTEE